MGENPGAEKGGGGEIPFSLDGSGGRWYNGSRTGGKYFLCPRTGITENGLESAMKKVRNGRRILVLCLALVFLFAGCGEQAPADTGMTEDPTETVGTETPQTEEPETEAPETEVKETEAPETEGKETEAPETEAPETEVKETEAPETEVKETEAPETEAPETEKAETEAEDKKDAKDDKDSKDAKESKDTKDDKDAKDSAKDTKDTTKDAKDDKSSGKDTKDTKATAKDAKDDKDSKDTKDAKDTKDTGKDASKDTKDSAKDTKDASKDTKEASKDTKDASKDESAAKDTAKDTAKEPAKEPAKEAQGESRIYNYLNGKTCTAAERLHRPVAIMLNNLRLQLPQFGLDYGQIYYECVTEGSITRLMMLVDSYENMGTVGSIRSSRDIFADFVADHDAVYVHAGGSPQAYNIISSRYLASLDGANMYLPSTYFRDPWRLNNIGYEHSLMTNGAGIVSGIQYKGYRTSLKEGFDPPFRFYSESENHMTGGASASHVRILSTPIQTVDFVYDANSGQYLRYQYNGQKHVDGATSAQIAVKNVIVLFTDISVIPGDEKARVAVTNVGTGAGWYFTNGQRAEIAWSRASSTDKMKYAYKDGSELILNAGKTFICVVDNAAAKTIAFDYQW